MTLNGVVFVTNIASASIFILSLPRNVYNSRLLFDFSEGFVFDQVCLATTSTPNTLASPCLSSTRKLCSSCVQLWMFSFFLLHSPSFFIFSSVSISFHVRKLLKSFSLVSVSQRSMSIRSFLLFFVCCFFSSSASSFLFDYQRERKFFSFRKQVCFSLSLSLTFCSLLFHTHFESCTV